MARLFQPEFLLMYRILRDFFLHKICPNNKVKDFIYRLLKDNLEFFRYNKLLVATGIMLEECFSFNTKITDSRLKRFELYLSEARSIVEKSYNKSIKIVIFKTFTEFPKDIADIDVLLYSCEELTNFENILKNMNYRRRKVGLEQNLWSKRINDTIIDLEVHTEIAAAEFKYYPKELVFKRALLKNGLILPSHIDTLLILASHSTIKDLYITLADLLNFAIVLYKSKINIRTLVNEASYLGLSLPVLLYIKILSLLGEDIGEWKEYLNNYIPFSYDGLVIRPSFYTTFLTYKDVFITKLKFEPLVEIIRQVLSLPRGKGLDALIKFALKEKPPVKSFDE
jgi:hypothetical protein